MKEKKINDQQAEGTEKTKKEKKPLSKKTKIWVACVTAFVFVVASVGTLFAFLPSEKLNWHGLSIANFKNYSSIGAASFGKNETASAVAYAADGGEKKKNMKLAGITKDDECQEIEFENDKGKMVKQKAHLILFFAYDNFTFLGFSTNKNKEFIEVEDLARFSLSNASGKYIHFSYPYADEEKQIDWDESCFLFILDNRTGMIYDVREIFDAVYKFLSKDVDYVSMQIANLGNGGSYITGYKEFVNKETLLLEVIEYNYDKNTNTTSLVSIEFEEKNIKVIEKMNSTQFNNFVAYDSSSLRYDKYGNIIKILGNMVEYQKKDGTFATDSSENFEYKFGFNNILYKHKSGGAGIESKTYYLNRQGEFEEIDFDGIIIEPCKFCVRRGNLVLATLYDTSYPNSSIELLKITLDEENDWNYSVERETIMSGAGYSTEIKGNYVFLFSKQVLQIYDMETKQLTNFMSKYTFQQLKYYSNTDIIKFKAVDPSTMLEVDGYFNENGEIVIGDFAGVKKGTNRVYVVKALN